MEKLPIFKCNGCNKRLSGDLNEQYINCDKCNSLKNTIKMWMLKIGLNLRKQNLI